MQPIISSWSHFGSCCLFSFFKKPEELPCSQEVEKRQDQERPTLPVMCRNVHNHQKITKTLPMM